MKYIRKIITMMGLTLAGLMQYQCNEYDIMGKMYPEARQLKVFVSSSTAPGNMSFSVPATLLASCNTSGLSNANCACNFLATSAGLTSNGEKFNAWLSDSSTDAACNIIGRNGNKLISNSCNGYSPINISYVDINGNTLFNSWNDITSGKTPERNINTTESNGPGPLFGVIANVWTGTANGGVNGAGGGTQCNNAGSGDWTFAGTSGIVGSFGNTAYWTVDGTLLGPPVGTTSCATAYPIYCFEQP